MSLVWLSLLTDLGADYSMYRVFLVFLGLETAKGKMLVTTYSCISKSAPEDGALKYFASRENVPEGGEFVKSSKTPNSARGEAERVEINIDSCVNQA